LVFFFPPDQLFLTFHLVERNAKKKEPFVVIHTSSHVVLPIRAEFKGSYNITKAHGGQGKRTRN
jgi:hypothetical protein